MKKRKLFALLLCAFLLLGVFTGCSTTPDQTPSQTQEPSQTVDLESMGLSPLEPTQEQMDNALPSSTEINSYMFSSQTLEDLCTNAGAAVRGTITDRYNAVYGGDAYTVYTIQVAQAYFGGPPVEETVTMVMAGGYVPLADVIQANGSADRFSAIPEAEWETTLVHQSILGAIMPEAGEEYVFFLMPDQGLSGYYYPFNDGQGILRFSASEGVYHRMVENETGLELVPAQTAQDFDALCVQTRTQVQEQVQAQSQTE